MEFFGGFFSQEIFFVINLMLKNSHLHRELQIFLMRIYPHKSRSGTCPVGNCASYFTVLALSYRHRLKLFLFTMSLSSIRPEGMVKPECG